MMIMLHVMIAIRRLLHESGHRLQATRYGRLLQRRGSWHFGVRRRMLQEEECLQRVRFRVRNVVKKGGRILSCHKRKIREKLPETTQKNKTEIKRNKIYK